MPIKYNFTQKQTDNIVNEYVNNLKPIYLIAKDYDVDSTVIKRILKENNVEIINGSAFSIEYWVQRGLSQDEAEQKVKLFKPIYKEYWINKGFTKEESELKVEIQTMKTERAFVTVYGIKGVEMFKDKMHKKGKKSSKRCVEYWLNNGYNEEDAKKKVSEHQRTYSRDMLHEKWGVEKGEKLLEIRNNKWQKSLMNHNDYQEIQKKKNSNGVQFVKEKHGDDYIKVYFKNKMKKIFKEKDEDCIIKSLECVDYEWFIKLVSSNYEYDGNLLRRISKLKIVTDVFHKESNVILGDILKNYGVRSKNNYGTTYLKYGIIFRSLTEVKIYDFLIENEIEFKYDSLYPKQKNKNKYDFYLNQIDTYIEYAGMLNIKKTEKNSRILENYGNKLNIKKLLCENNNFNYFFSSSFDEIISFIKEKYGKED